MIETVCQLMVRYNIIYFIVQEEEFYIQILIRHIS